MPDKSSCSIDGCDGPARKRGWCTAHYKRWRKHGDAGYERPSTLDRFVAKIDFSECWQWKAFLRGDGYGVFFVRRDDGVELSVAAHRWSYEFFNGPIPEGLHIDHLCRTRSCVNPDHLETVTPKENLRRSPIAPATKNAAKTHCKRGHEFVAENVYNPPGTNERQCRVCNRMRSRASYRKVSLV